MADTVVTQTLIDGPRHIVVKVSAVSDGTGLNKQQIVDASSLVPVPTRMSLSEVWFAVQGYEAVLIESDQTSDHPFARCAGDGYFDFRDYGGVVDSGTGGNGDILFTTVGTAAANDTFDITMKFKKKFD